MAEGTSQPVGSVLPGLQSIEATQTQLGGLGKTKTYELIRNGQLKSVKIGRRRLVVASSVTDFLTSLGAA